MLTPEVLSNLLAIADVRRNPYAVTAAAGSLLTAVPGDATGARSYFKALAALRLGAAVSRMGKIVTPAEKSEGIVSWASRTRLFAANLRILAARDIVGAQMVADAAQAELKKYELHLAADGNYHVLNPQAAETQFHTAWLGPNGTLVNQKAATRLWVFDRAKTPLPPPVAFDGLGMGWMPLHVAQTTFHTQLQYSCALYFLEPDPLALAILLHAQDLRQLIADKRVHWFIADTPEKSLALFYRALAESRSLSLPGGVIRCALRMRNGVAFEPAVKELYSARDLHRQDRLAVIGQAYADKTPAYWRGRFQAALADRASGEPLRVLGIGSRFLPGQQEAMAELKTAVERENRAQFAMAIEPDDHSLENPMLHRIAEFRPDVIVQLAPVRHQKWQLPANIPLFTWNLESAPTQQKTAGEATTPPASGPAVWQAILYEITTRFADA